MTKVAAALGPCAPAPAGGSREGAHGRLRITFAVVACVTTEGAGLQASRLSGLSWLAWPGRVRGGGHAGANRGMGRHGAGRWGGRRAGGGCGGDSRGVVAVPLAPPPCGGLHQHGGEVCAADGRRRGGRAAGAVATAGGARSSPAY